MARVQPREWLSVEVDKDHVPERMHRRHPDEDRFTIMFDVTFLGSSYRCVYGNGCKGGWGSQYSGCCSTGPLIDQQDVDNVERMIPKLSEEYVEHYREITTREWHYKSFDEKSGD